MGLEDLQEFSALYSGNSLGYFSAELLCIDNVIIDNYHSWIEIAFDAITTFNFSNRILFVTGDICPSFLTINEELNSNLKLQYVHIINSFPGRSLSDLNTCKYLLKTF